VWTEAFRVRRGGVPLEGFTNPVTYPFDYEPANSTGVLQVKHALPYSGLTSLTVEEGQQHIETDAPIEFRHTLEGQID
jgi:hypothetical protein